MKNRNFVVLRMCLPIGLSVALGVVACGGSDSGGANTGGGAGTSSASGGSASNGGSSATAGGTSKAGASNTAGSNSAGSNSGSPGDFDTGLPANTPISDLTDAEIAGLCSKFDEFYSTGSVGTDLKEFSCRFSGIFAAALGGADTDAKAQAACKTAYDACVVAPTETTEECSKPTGMCTATVGEIEACANDSAKALQQLTSSFPSCSELTLADLMDLGGGGDTESQQPASCATVEMKCPDAPTPPSAM